MTRWLGLAVASPVADVTSNQLWFIIGGFMALAAGLISFSIRDVRDIGAGIDEDKIVPPEGEDRKSIRKKLENTSS